MMSRTITRVAVVFLPLLAVPAFSRIPTAQEKSPSPPDPFQLALILKAGREYCQRLGRAALDFVCQEEVTDRIDLSKDSRQLRDPTKAAADAIRTAIKKLLRNLLEPRGCSASSHAARKEFAEHIQRYLITPSGRYAAPSARKARGELTGCLLYEPPAGIFWVVSQ